jgi:hypothetical protein
MRPVAPRWALPTLLLLALPLSGCLSIKSEAWPSGPPGTVTLGGVVRGTDYDR